jgi:hypothetical protein
MDDREIAARAVEAGLDLTPEQLAQLARATALTRRLADLVPRDLPLAEEPALTLRLHRRGRA